MKHFPWVNHNWDEMKETAGFPQAWSETLRQDSEMGIVSDDFILLYLFFIFINMQ